MDNILEALYKGFGVMLFCIALALFMSLDGKVKTLGEETYRIVTGHEVIRSVRGN